MLSISQLYVCCIPYLKHLWPFAKSMDMIMYWLHSIICFNSFSAPNLEHILAVANEEGFVRLYDTEAQTPSKLIFKGKCCVEGDLHLM